MFGEKTNLNQCLYVLLWWAHCANKRPLESGGYQKKREWRNTRSRLLIVNITNKILCVSKSIECVCCQRRWNYTPTHAHDNTDRYVVCGLHLKTVGHSWKSAVTKHRKLPGWWLRCLSCLDSPQLRVYFHNFYKSNFVLLYGREREAGRGSCSLSVFM